MKNKMNYDVAKLLKKIKHPLQHILRWENFLPGSIGTLSPEDIPILIKTIQLVNIIPFEVVTSDDVMILFTSQHEFRFKSEPYIMWLKILQPWIEHDIPHKQIQTRTTLMT